MKIRINSGLVMLCLLVAIGCRPSGQVGELVGVNETPPIEDTKWEMTSLKGENLSPPLYYLQLVSKDKSISGFSTCNKLSGTYTLQGKKLNLELDNLGASKIACDEEIKGTTKGIFLEEMKNVDGYEIQGRTMQLKKGKDVIANFRVQVRATY